MAKFDPWYRILKEIFKELEEADLTGVAKFDPWYRILKERWYQG